MGHEAAAKNKAGLLTQCGTVSPGVVLAVAWIGYFSFYIGRKPVAVAKRVLASELGLTPGHLGLLDTSFLACYACGSFTGGALGDKYGERAVLTVVTAGSALACFLFAICEDPTLLAVCWGLNGIMQGVPYPCYMKLLGLSFGAKLGSAAGLWQTSAYAGGAAGNMLAGYLLTQFPWQVTFFVPSAVLAACSVATLMLTPTSSGEECSEAAPEVELSVVSAEEPDARQRRNLVLGDADGSPSHSAEQQTEQEGAVSRVCHKALRVIRIPGLVNVSLAYFLVKLVRYAILFWLPYYLINERHYSTTSVGPLSSCFELGGLLGCTLAGFATDAWADGHRFRVVVPLLVASACLLFAYADGAQLLLGEIPVLGVEAPAAPFSIFVFDFVVLSCLGVCVSGPDSILAGPAAQDLAKLGGDLGVATVVGIVDGIGSLGSVMQGAVTTTVSTKYGWASLYRLLGLLLVCSCVLCVSPMRIEARRIAGGSAPGGPKKLQV
mmetsp:Transcript_27375/g.71131  ORF Transcript_27375/g.71131 Transcript_27375/m.71131 type:complete len:493 (-) Transcript_27375:38-1516(-)